VRAPSTPTGPVTDPDIGLLSHHRGLVGELDEEMQAPEEELERELGDLGKGPP